MIQKAVKRSRLVPLAAFVAALGARSSGASESSAMVSVCEVVRDVTDEEIASAVELAYAF